MWQVIAVGFSLGLLGSVHCIGMCGPIALAIPVHNLPPFQRYAGIVLYNAGRVITYVFLGLIFSVIGQQLFIGNYQRMLSITIGVMIIVVLLLNILFRKQVYTFPLYRKFINRLQSSMAVFMRREHSLFSLLAIGFLNGWLPCGLVYIAISGAVALSDPAKGMLFMFGFGISTMPLMLSVSFLGNKFIKPYRLEIQRIMPVLIFCMGMLFILRGMNLGIPYLSPKIEQTSNGTDASCCHKK